MATPNVGILTTAGKALIDKVNSGQAKISFSKIVFSSMDNSQLSDMQVKALTAIAPQEVVVSSPETTLDTNSGETRIRATGTNEKLADGVYVKTYGVFAKDDTGNEILYGVTVSPNPNYFPAYDGVTPQAVTYSYKTVIQETSNITMTNSNDVYVSQEDLTEAIAAIPKPDLSNYATQQQLATKADDSKVVHNTDMRKPASDVAGIEEVNTKQDKIGYTPADDSKVVHSADTANWQKSKITADHGDVLKGLLVANNDDLSAYLSGIPTGITTFYVQSGVANNPSNKSARGLFHRSGDGNGVGYLIDINGAQWSILLLNKSITYTRLETSAIESKVVHNTGTEEIAGTKTFDTAPIDKTTGNPYITKDGVPTVDLSSYAKTSDVTTAISTATANMVDSTNPTNFTAGLQSGGVDVATAADLKSVEASAWRLTALPDVPAVTGINMLYKIDSANNLLYIVLNGKFRSITSSDTNELLVANLSAIVKGISGINLIAADAGDGFFYPVGSTAHTTKGPNIVYSGTKLILESPYADAPTIQVPNNGYLSILYGSTIKYTELV